MRKVLYILGALNDEDVEWMAATGRKRVAHDGELLIRQGSASADLFFVLDGHAVVTVAGVGDVARLGTGEIVGELSFVDSAPPSATVAAERGCVILALAKHAVASRLRSDTAFAARFYRALALFLADRLRSANTRGSSAGLARSEIAEDELDDGLLDTVSLAGVRFERMLEILTAAPLSTA